MLTDLSAIELFHQQLALERKGVDGSGRMFRLPGENPDPIGRVLTARFPDGTYVAYFRDDSPPGVLSALRALTPERIHHDNAHVLDILGSTAIWHGRTYVFVAIPQPDEYAIAVRQDDRFLVQVDGVTAAEAWSARATELAAELAVETRPEFRRRGFARQASAAWSSHQLLAGRTAFYSHDQENTASAALARSLGVRHFMDNVSYE